MYLHYPGNERHRGKPALLPAHRALHTLRGIHSQMKHSGRVSGFSLSKELSSLAEFRSYTIGKLQNIEKLIAGMDGSIGADLAGLSTVPSTKRFGADHDPAIAGLA